MDLSNKLKGVYMELLEMLIIGPLAYICLRFTIKQWNSDVEAKYNDAQHTASILLGQGQKVEAMQVMDKALTHYRKFYIRKVLGVKI